MTLHDSAEISCQADRFGYDAATIYSRILCVISVKRMNSFIHSLWDTWNTGTD